MGDLIRTIVGALFLVLVAGAALGEDLMALARLDPAGSEFADTAEGLQLRLSLSQPVPWRVRVLDAPPRLVIDMREVDWSGLHEIAQSGARIKAVRAGVFRPGWSRLVLELTGPMLVRKAGMATADVPGDATLVEISLGVATLAEFAAAADLEDPAEWALPVPVALNAPPAQADGPLVVVLDPGHGGIDPGAERGGVKEADVMLAFAREVKEVLLRAGLEVVLTREADVFVPLEQRITVARAARATLFISLHADALAEGEAEGATIYTLSDAASDAATAALSERHDRDDLLAGIDLSDQDDLVAGVLMDMARTETAPRTGRLADALARAIRVAGLKMHPLPLQSGGFSVLKSPDVPALLLELGFLSNAEDFSRLTDPGWRARMAVAIAGGIAEWAAEDADLQARRPP